MTDTRQPTGWFLIRDHDGLYEGTIVKMYLKPGENPASSAISAPTTATASRGWASTSSAA
jgi:hypothetical protein